MDNLSEYFQQLTGEKSERAIARKAGLDQSTLNRQLKGSLTVETVVAICRAYKLDLAPVFVAVDFLTQDEADQFSHTFQLSQIPELELAREIVRRLEAGEAGPALTDPIDPNIDTLPPSNVTELRPNVGDTAEDLPSAARTTDPDDGEDHT